MNLYLLRHAIAVERGAAGFEDDRTRPLTDEGRDKMKRIAKGMSALGLKFDLILTSPYVRARQTAELAAAELGLAKRLKLEPSLAADRQPAEILSRLEFLSRRNRRVLLVGHEPFLGELARRLVGAPAGALSFKKGGLAGLSLTRFTPAPVAHLDWLLTPKQLRMLAAGDDEP